jgi:predicted transcriptional regulator
MRRPRSRGLDLRGDLQAEIMAAVWRLGEGKVEEVRAQLPSRRRSAYNTVQTVMNRLVERGLLARQRRGNAYVYRPTLDEGDHLARAMQSRLSGASPTARRAALMNLLGSLEPDELEELARMANRTKRGRPGG